MRREGFEFMVGRPRVLFKWKNNVKTEPIEHLVLDLDAIYQGTVLSTLQKRKGLL